MPRSAKLARVSSARNDVSCSRKVRDERAIGISFLVKRLYDIDLMGFDEAVQLKTAFEGVRNVFSADWNVDDPHTGVPHSLEQRACPHIKHDYAAREAIASQALNELRKMALRAACAMEIIDDVDDVDFLVHAAA